MKKIKTTLTAKRRDQTLPDDVTRSVVIDRSDDGAVRFDVSASSEEPVRDFFDDHPVALLHERNAIESDGGQLSLLVNHDIDRVVGSIRDLKLDEKTRKYRGTLDFDEDEESARYKRKVEKGSIRGLSIRYRATESVRLEEGEKWTSPGGRAFQGPLIVATRWVAREVSLTPLPADASVGVGRSESGRKPEMNDVLRKALEAKGLSKEASDEEAVRFLNELGSKPETVEKPAEEGIRVTNNVITKKTDDDVIKEAVRAENARASELDEIARTANVEAEKLAEWKADLNFTPDEARRYAIKVMAAANEPLGEVSGSRVELDGSAVDRASRAIELDLMRRLRVPMNDEETKEANGIRRFSIEDSHRTLARVSGESDSHEADRLGLTQLTATRAGGYASGHFLSLLENVANKTLARAYDEAPTTYQQWTVAGQLTDFKAASRANLGAVGDYKETPDLAPIHETTIGDANENIQLATYAEKLTLGRQAMLSDDLNGFGRILSLFAAAGARTINNLVYAHLTGSVTMAEDSTALFATTHDSGSNLITTALSQAAIAELKTLMRKQLALKRASTDDDARLNITPKYLIVPADLELTAQQVVNGVYVPTAEASAKVTQNMEIIVEAALTSAVDWFMSADPSQVDTIEVARLVGQSAPVLERIENPNPLSTSWVSFLDVGVRALNHRGLGMANV